MSCTQKQQLVCFPKVRVYKPWFRHFNDHKDFRNEGTVHLFSLMALFSYANFRSNERVINGDRYMEAPGQWICKLGALPRILRVHSKTQALELMEYFQNHGFLTFEILDEEKEILRFTIADWKEHCTHLQYNYYSYKGSGFFFFPLPVGRLLLKTARKEVGIVFSELDAIMDMITCKNDRLLELLWFVGYCIEFPTQLAVRIGGGAEWNRRVMYRAIREGYVKLYRRKHKRHVIRSLSLTQKGFDYVAQSDPEAVAMIYSRINCSERVYPSKVDKILRLHAIAVGTVMAHAADAEILISQKPSLMSPAKRTSNTITPDPTQCYYYASHELRVAIEEYSPESVSKSSRTIGIVVKGKHCYFLYFTGSTRMYWMKNSEENYAAAVKSLLLARGFGVTTIHQVVIGSTMSVAQRLCHSAKPFGNKYFVVSTFFAQCLFLTNNPDGDSLMKIILNPDMALELNQAILAPYHPPRTPNREYDAIDVQHDKPVILNYQCDLQKLSDIRPIPEGFRGSPIMLCFDYQTQTVQGIVGPAIEVRPVESMNNHGKKKTENNP